MNKEKKNSDRLEYCSPPPFEAGKQLKEPHCLEHCQGTAVVWGPAATAPRLLCDYGCVAGDEAPFEAKGRFPKVRNQMPQKCQLKTWHVHWMWSSPGDPHWLTEMNFSWVAEKKESQSSENWNAKETIKKLRHKVLCPLFIQQIFLENLPCPGRLLKARGHST